MSSILTTFCCLVTLQVGVAVLSASFFTMSAAILATNVFSYGLKTGHTWPVNLILVIVFVIWLVTAASLTIASAHTESRSLAITSSVAIAVLTCYWIILCGVSFTGDSEAVDAVCIEDRCPESLWIANLKYRNSTSTRRVNRTSAHNETSARNVTTSLSEDDDISDHLYRDEPLRDYSYYYMNTTAVNQDKKLRSHNYTYHLFGAIILFIINVSFFIYSVFVMWRWASELDWTDPVETEPELAPTPRPAPKPGPILNPEPAPRPRPAPAVAV